MSNIGFIGLGNMGWPMALNLVKAGHSVSGFDVSFDVDRDSGIAIYNCAVEATKEADFVITMLPDGAVVLSVLEEIRPSLKSGAVVINCSTIDFASANKMHQHCRDSALACLDAPVSGGINGAADGTLTFIVGGESAVLEQARQLFDAMGNKIVHCGDAGSGQAAKICNNLLLAISMVGTCESLALGKKLGLAPETLFEVLSTSSGACWSLNQYTPLPHVGAASPADNNFTPGFPAKMMVKDMTLVQQAAEIADQITPLGQHTLELYKQFTNAGGADTDFSGIIRFLENLSEAKHEQ